MSTCPAGLHGTSRRQHQAPGFELRETVYPPDATLPEHEHAEPFACFVVGGVFEERARHGVDTVASLTTLVRPSGERHANRFGRAGGRCLNLLLAPAWLDTVGAHALLGEPRLVVNALTTVAGLRVHAALERGVAPEVLEAAVLAWLWSLHPEVGRESLDDGLTAVRRLLDASDTPVPREVLATLAGCHPITLARRFRRQWGVAPAEYARMVRWRKACVEAARSQEPLSEVAARFGFADQAHLTRTMVTLVGLPPATLRRSLAH